MAQRLRFAGPWHGFVPPQYVYAQRTFKSIVVDPPDFEPGSWTGAGKALFDPISEQFLLTARPRSAADGVRGFAANIYRSDDGESFELAYSLTKEAVAEASGIRIHSIEGTQLLRDPLSGRWHLYLSVDAGEGFIWGGLYWQTLLMVADEIDGPWESRGLVLRNDEAYDACQARDSTIDIVDGVWICLYKAMDEERFKRPGLATSADGIEWTKHGPMTIEGKDAFAFLSGTIFAGTGGPLFMGVERLGDDRAPKDVVYADGYQIGHGTGPAPNFVAYRMDLAHGNLEPIFRRRWEPLSPYERQDQPLLGYSSIVYDPLNHRMLTYVEAIDPELTRQMGLNETVERVLLYETLL